jgi:4-azaleucine resistance transporter AzlC
MHSFSKGLVAAIPIASGYIPVAITFGLVVRATGLTTVDAFLASLLVFAGAAQFLAIGMYGAAGLVAGTVSPASLVVIAQIVIAGWLLNLRHLLMSSVIAHNLNGARGILTRSVLAFGVTDEVFGVAGWRIAEGGTVRPRYLLGLELGAYSAWVGGTVVGALSGEILPHHLQVAMGLALYALFAALLAGQFRAAHQKEGTRVAPLAVAAGSAALINAALRGGLGWDAGAAFPVAMVAGALIAMATGAGTDSGPGEDTGVGVGSHDGSGRGAIHEEGPHGSF